MLVFPWFNDTKSSLVDILEIAAPIPQMTTIMTSSLDRNMCAVYVKQISDSDSFLLAARTITTNTEKMVKPTP